MLTLNSVKIAFISSALIPLVLRNNQFQAHIAMVSPLCVSNHDIQHRVAETFGLPILLADLAHLSHRQLPNSHALSVMTSPSLFLDFSLLLP